MNAETPSDQTQRLARRPRWWPWHQRLGLAFAGVFLVVIFTGISLNHTGDLALDRHVIRANWLYDWYGIELSGDPTAFAVGDDWLVEWDGQVVWQERALSRAEGLRGAALFDGPQVLVLTDELWVLTPEGELVERLNSASLPAGEPLRLGRAGGNLPVVLETTTGVFISSATLLQWLPAGSDLVVSWVSPTPLPASQRATIREALRGEDLTLYRVLLDLHSGRFFGRAGVWIVDASAVALAFLTLTGTWYALKIKRRA
jgi:hypothetical protein